MKIKDLFKLDIERHIDPAIVVGKNDSKTIEAEIEEYVFTRGIINNLYKILDSLLNQQDGKTGIWINGYYGSGKSHFIKYLHYLIHPSTSEKAFKYWYPEIERLADLDDEVSPSKVKLLEKQIKRFHIEDDLFNIEDISDDNADEKLTRILLRRLCKLQGLNTSHIPLALTLEKRLQEKEIFEAFQQKMLDEHDLVWKGQEQNITVMACQTVVDTAHELDPSIDKESLRQYLQNPESFDITIETTLIPQLKDFLKKKGDDYRLLFLVDEVSQYMGQDNNLILNLQNIVERISEFDGKVWLACTAQQTLEDLIRNADQKPGGSKSIEDKFGKILGRFDTKISLESQDATYITQKRVLSKKSAAEKRLAEQYKQDKDALHSQFAMPHSMYKGYDSEDAFLMSYPFVPYQFKLISDVFHAFRQKDFVIEQVKNNERSILSVTHFTAKNYAEKEVGCYVSFDAFFNGLMRENLTNNASRVLAGPLSLDFVKEGSFDQRVVFTLFMLSNLSEVNARNFPSTLENIARLLISSLDDSRLQLQQDVKRVLDRLIDENVAYQNNNGSYFFFTEEEMEMQAQIRNTQPNNDERLEFYQDMLSEVLSLRRKAKFANRSFNVQVWVDEKRVFPHGEIEVDLSVQNDQPAENRALDNSMKRLLIPLGELIKDDQEFLKKVLLAIQTQKFFKHFSGQSSASRNETATRMKTQQKQRTDAITEKLKTYFTKSRFISGNQVYEAGHVTGRNPAERYEAMVGFHIGQVYKHHDLAAKYAADASTLQAFAASPQIEDKSLSPAEQKVESVLKNQNMPLSVEDLVKRFDQAPFGWSAFAIAHILMQLSLKGKRRLSYRNDEQIGLQEFAQKAIRTGERAALLVKKVESIDPAELKKAADIYFNVFQQQLSPSTDPARFIEELNRHLDVQLDEYKPLKIEYYGRPDTPFGHSFELFVDRLTELRNATKWERKMELLTNFQQELSELRDAAQENKELAQRHLAAYKNLRNSYESFKHKKSQLGEAAIPALETLKELYESKRPQTVMRRAKNAQQELKKLMDAQRKSAEAEVQKKITEEFERAVSVARQEGVDEAFIASEEASYKDKIEKLESPDELRLLAYEVESNCKTLIDKVYKTKARESRKEGEQEPEVQNLQLNRITRVIRNEEELEQFLAQTRTKISKLLAEKKHIILR